MPLNSSAPNYGCNVDVAVITETHLKKKHAASCINIDKNVLFRRDRVHRKCGGVAVYVRQSMKASVCKCASRILLVTNLVMSCFELNLDKALTSLSLKRCNIRQHPSIRRKICWIISM